MRTFRKKPYISFLVIVALVAWCIPGAGYLLLNEKKRAFIIFVTISLTFILGIYVASIGVIDPIRAKFWFIAQILTSPLVAILGTITTASNFPVYGRTYEIGQIYTSIAGLLNLLCIINSTYFAYNKLVPHKET